MHWLTCEIVAIHGEEQPAAALRNRMQTPDHGYHAFQVLNQRRVVPLASASAWWKKQSLLCSEHFLSTSEFQYRPVAFNADWRHDMDG